MNHRVFRLQHVAVLLATLPLLFACKELESVLNPPKTCDPVAATSMIYEFPKLIRQPKAFNSCAELDAHLASLRPPRMPEGCAVPDVSIANPHVPPNASEPVSRDEVIRQDADVMEPDFVAHIGERTFVARANRIEVFNRTNALLESPILLPTFKPEGQEMKLLTWDDQLIVIVPLRTDLVDVHVFDVKSQPKQVQFHTFEGRFTSVRLWENKLRLVVEKSTIENLRSKGQTLMGIACTKIHGGSFDRYQTSLTQIHELDLGSRSLDSVGVIGWFPIQHSSKDSLYLLNSQGVGDFQGHYATAVRKIDYTNKLDVVSGDLRGRVPHAWAAKEIKKPSAHLVLTVNDTLSALNSVRIFDSALKETARSDEFGYGENLHAVRYFGDKVYAVTYRNVDPLHIVDLSDLTRPTLKSTLTVPGFSDWLAPLGNSLLFGIGFTDATVGGLRSLQYSLFNIHDPLRPILLQSVPMSYGYIDSPVRYDSNAFYFDSETSMIGFPAVGSALSGPSDYHLFSVRDHGLSPAFSTSHSDFLPADCRTSTFYSPLGVSRIIRDQRLLTTISKLGVKIYKIPRQPSGDVGTLDTVQRKGTPDGYSLVSSVEFPENVSQCPASRYGSGI